MGITRKTSLADTLGSAAEVVGRLVGNYNAQCRELGQQFGSRDRDIVAPFEQSHPVALQEHALFLIARSGKLEAFLPSEQRDRLIMLLPLIFDRQSQFGDVDVDGLHPEERRSPLVDR